MDEKRNARYMEKVERRGPDECWPWKASRNTFGYGTFRGDGDQLAHRYGYRLHVGPIPPGLVICHTCDNPPCQNPRHWFIGTPGDNNADRDTKGRRRTRPALGQVNGNTHLTPEDVVAIRAAYSAGSTQKSIANDFGVTQQAVSKLVNALRWQHLDGAVKISRPIERVRGDGHPNSKITAAVAQSIRERYAGGGFSQQGLADEYGISQNAVSNIIRNKTWAK